MEGASRGLCNDLCHVGRHGVLQLQLGPIKGQEQVSKKVES